MSIKSKLISLIFIIIIIFGGLTTYNYYESKSIMTEQLNMSGIELVKEKAKQIDSYFYEAESIIRNIAFAVEKIIETNPNITDVQDSVESAHEVQSQINEVSDAAEKVTLDSEQLAKLVIKLQQLIEQFKLS